MKISKRLASFSAIAAFGLAAMAFAEVRPFSALGLFTQTNVGFAPSEAQTVTLEIFKTGTSSQFPKTNGVVLIRHTKVRSKVTVDPELHGVLTFELDGLPLLNGVASLDAKSVSHILDLTSIENIGPVSLKANVNFAKDGVFDASDRINVEVDTEGPILSYVEFVGGSAAKSTDLHLHFRKNDLATSAKNLSNFKVEKIAEDGTPTVIPNVADDATPPTDKLSVNKIRVDANDVYLSINGTLLAGDYRVTALKTLEDKAGNSAGRISSTEKDRTQSLVVSRVIYGPAEEAIDFPQYTRRSRSSRNSDFNPGNHVETRVVRLYYQRDAYRVARIVNRDIKQLNRGGVDNARRIADSARDAADSARTSREKIERQAIQVAEQIRVYERQLTVAKQNVSRAQQQEREIEQLKNQIEALGPPSGKSEPSPEVVQFDSIEFVTLSRATINNASITNSTVSGGVPDAQGDTRTGGTLIGGNLTSGQITKGFITWTDAAGTKRRGEITAGDINADATSIVSVSRGEITGVTTGGSPTPTGVSGATTSATVVENAIVRNAVLVNVVVEKLVTQTFNKNQSQIDLLTKQLTRMGGTLKPRTVGENDSETKTPTSPLEKAEQAVKDIEEKIAKQRQAINEAKERVATAERKELLANRNQFETGVAAGTSDPDSYAAADLSSIDPVMQVSISVIGEGLIQLRGPIRGINEIRTMINQIDAPLGQVKIGLFTLQINGERGTKWTKWPLGWKVTSTCRDS
jgi:predicted  nucleic acid-binding Zn-ribbon protein